MVAFGCHLNAPRVRAWRSRTTPQTGTPGGSAGGDPVALDRRAHLGERLAGDVVDLARLRPRPLRVLRGERLDELRLEDDHREGVPEQVVEVSGDPIALGDPGQPLHLGAGHTELRGLQLTHGEVGPERAQDDDA